MQDVLIMGAGYVGTALIKALKGKPYELSLTTVRVERIEELKKLSKSVLLLKPGGNDGLEKQVEECDVLIVLVAPRQGESYESAYLNTAGRISDALERRERPPYLIYTSSISVCEGASVSLVTETTPLNPVSKNAKILLETEGVYLRCRANTCILRLGGIYGPGRDLTDRALRFSGREMEGNPDKPTNSIHLEDIVSAILFSLDHRQVGIYHLVNDDHRSRKELYEGLCASMQLPLPLWKSSSNRESDAGYTIANQKIKDCGFIFKHPYL